MYLLSWGEKKLYYNSIDLYCYDLECFLFYVEVPVSFPVSLPVYRSPVYLICVFLFVWCRIVLVPVLEINLFFLLLFSQKNWDRQKWRRDTGN